MMAVAMIQRAEFEPITVVERLADTISEQMLNTGKCEIQTLLDLGFHIDDVNRHWAEANRLAAKLRPRPMW